MSKTIKTGTEQELMDILYSLLKIKHQIIEIGTKHNLTLMQSFTLLILDKPKTTLKISSIYNCYASNVSGIIDGLEAKRLIVKKADPKDHRVKHINLTAKGLLTRKKLVEKLNVDCLSLE